MTVLRENTFGVIGFKEMEVTSDIPLPPVEIKERIPQAIKWRSLFLAHFYDIKGNQLDTVTYFDKWEEKKTPQFVLGPSFHPGNFAAAFGHSIAWESMIDTVCFQSFAPTSFARMLLSILENASTIDRLAFSDFRPREIKDQRLPQFPAQTIEKTTIKEWWILRSSFEIIRLFCKFAKYLTEPLGDFLIATSQFTAEELTEFNEYVQDTPALAQMKSFHFVRNYFRKFPHKKFLHFLSVTTNLQTLTLVGLDTNASELLSTFCRAKSSVKVLNMTHMQFRSAVAEDAWEMLLTHSWPGNLDELRNVLERACILGSPPCIQKENLLLNNPVFSDNNKTADKTLKTVLAAFKKEYVTRILAENSWNQTAAARVLAIQRTYLSRLIKELGIREK